VLAGGGVAGLEALLALDAAARDLVELTLVAPEPRFHLRAMSVTAPFSGGTPREWPVEALCRARGARFLQARVVGVDAPGRHVALDDARRLPYDALLLATGARRIPVFPEALTFRGMQDAAALHGLVEDVVEGWDSRIAFVVPDGVTWPLPLYELALLLADRAARVRAGVRLTLVTPEAAPLEAFGLAASNQVGVRLRQAGVELLTCCRVADVRDGHLLDAGGAVLAEAQRVVALPRLTGRPLAGLPQDPDGFLPVDAHGRVAGRPGVWAAGDGTTSPYKHGGIAAQQADAACADIARAAGADVAPRPLRPVLRGQLLTGGRPLFLRHVLDNGASESTAGEHLEPSPAAKVAAPRLTAWLGRGACPGAQAVPDATVEQLR